MKLDGYVAVSPAEAFSLATLIAEGRRAMRVQGVVTLPAHVSRVIDEINQSAQGFRDRVREEQRTVEPVQWVTTASAADRASVSSEAIRKAALRGDLVSKRSGRLWLVSESSLEVWLANRFANPHQPSPTAQIDDVA